MDGGILSLILVNFKAASEHNAVELINLLEPGWFTFARLAFVLLLVAAWFERERGLAIICVGVLWLGFTHWAFSEGPFWAQSLSDGTRTIAQKLGAPANDPSAVVQLGVAVAKPLFSATANQGTLSYIRKVWAGGMFMLAGVGIFLAFVFLAVVQFAVLLMNYLLIGGAPFFLLFMAVPGLNMLTELWLRLMAGNLAAIFTCSLIAKTMNDFGGQMKDQYNAVFANAVDVTTLTVADWAGPLGTAIVLGVAYAWVALSFSKAAMGAVSNLWSAAGVALSLGASAITAGPFQSGSSSSSSGGGSSNATPILSAPHGSSSGGSSGGGSGNSGGSMGPAQTPAGWGGGAAQQQAAGRRS